MGKKSNENLLFLLYIRIYMIFEREAFAKLHSNKRDKD